MLKKFIISIVVTSLFFVMPASAHEFWVEPSSYQPLTYSRVAVQLFVGEPFEGEAVARDPNNFLRFVVHNDAEKRKVIGLDGAVPAGYLAFEQPGLQVIGYRSDHFQNFLHAEAFEDYLKEDGLEQIVHLRKRWGEDKEPGREVFSRCAKALIKVQGESNNAMGHDYLLGLTLELVPEKNPYEMKANEKLPVKVIYEGKPLENILLVAVNKDDPKQKFAARTDRDGRVSFELARSGVWLVSGVHMVRAAEELDADWESIWGSLTFEIPEQKTLN